MCDVIYGNSLTCRMNNILGTKMSAMDKKQQKRLAKDTKQKAAFCWSPATKNKEWNVMTLVRRDSDFSFFAVFYCSCLGFNELLPLPTKERGNNSVINWYKASGSFALFLIGVASLNHK